MDTLLVTIIVLLRPKPNFMKNLIFLFFIAFSTIVEAQVDTNSTSNSPKETSLETNPLNTQASTAPSATQEKNTTKNPKKPKSRSRNENEKKSLMPFIKRFYFGGTFGATFGKYTSVTVAPTIGYRLKPSLYTGLKVYYTYSKQKNLGTSYEYHNYGVGTFLRWFAFSDLYLHVAPELISYEYTTQGQSQRDWVPYLWAGAGIRKRTSKRSWVSVHVLFDILNNKNSPFDQWEPNVVIGAGTSF
jgi:hypothetical protein